MFMMSEASEQYPAMPSAYYIYLENSGYAMIQAMLAGTTLELVAPDTRKDHAALDAGRSGRRPSLKRWATFIDHHQIRDH